MLSLTCRCLTLLWNGDKSGWYVDDEIGPGGTMAPIIRTAHGRANPDLDILELTQETPIWVGKLYGIKNANYGTPAGRAQTCRREHVFQKQKILLMDIPAPIE